jgi:dTDP-4-amino-4,6-dideoxygalactose transaminase
MKSKEILTVFHYLSLHKSEFYESKHDGRTLLNANKYTNQLVRLPFYFELDVEKVITEILKYEKPN